MDPTTAVPTSFTYHSSLERFNISPQAYLAANPTLTDLVVSAILFDKPLNRRATETPPRTLLIQRAATDGYALYWECPGGGVELGHSSHPHSPPQLTTTKTVTTAEDTATGTIVSKYYEENVQQGHAPDRTILAAVVREVLEETGLKVAHIGALIDDTCEFGNKKGTIRARKFTFLVDFERQTETADEEVKVMLNPAEHQDVMWASEEEVVRGEEVSRDGGASRKIAFAFDDQKDRLLETFKILKAGL